MSKKIKIILITFITLIITLILGKDIFAWSPINQTPIFPQQNSYFCKQKDGPVRFTQIDPEYSEVVYSATVPENGLVYVESQIKSSIKLKLQQKMESLADYARPIPSNSIQLIDYNGDFKDDDDGIVEAGNYLYGAKTAMTPVYNVVGTFDIQDTRTAYIFSSGLDQNPIQKGFLKGNYIGSESDIMDLEMQQLALWNDVTYNEGRILTGSKLYAEAVDFENFYKQNNIANGYEAKLDTTRAQVISNQKNETYILGPFKLTYPDDVRFSYIQDMKVVTDTGYSVQPTNVLFKTKGADKQYPSSGEEFFVEFSAKDTNYPTKAGINVSFAYIKTTTATYERQEGTGDIYQIIGEYTREFSYHQEDWRIVDEKTGEQRDFGQDYYVLGGKVYLKKTGEYIPQVTAHLVTYDRNWSEHELIVGKGKKKNVTEFIDLTMELGGTVWADEDGGKESISNGILDNGEKRIPNIPVSLYKEDGTLIGTTKTNSNGEYKFTNLNAMFKYYVKFTYNGQYYQPTTYASSNTWGEKGWINNSNATDIRSQRLEFNAKFASIGSAAENYVGSAGANQTYTREQLINAGIIDEFGNLISESNASMTQYVRDCMMDAYTGNGDGLYDLYPVPDIFVIDTFQYPSILTPKAEPLYSNAYHINLGLDAREEADLAIKKDIDHVTLEINGQTHTYTYDSLENKENAENEWDISVRLSDAYYNTNYSRELYKSDYIYKASMYGDNAAVLGKSKADELEVYVTYKIMVRNQSLSIKCKVNELVDYYDNDLEYVDSRSYIQIRKGENEGIYGVNATSDTRYSLNTKTSIAGYDTLYVRGLDDKYLTAGQTAYVYLTFKVKKDTINGEDWIRLDEQIESGAAIGVGKENIVEINGYSTIYAPGTQVPNVGEVGGTPAGIVDRDSNPGNLNPTDVPKDGNINYNNFEDDTDKAPNIRIILYRNDDATRVISGSVWEDLRTERIESSMLGNGIKDNSESLIDGVTVQLVELMDNGTEFIWRTFEEGSGTASSTSPIINAYNLVSDYEFEGNHEGQYAFKSFVPGKYIVRFIYGDTIRTLVPTALGGLNDKSYNGQDYKSTTYQEGIDSNQTYTWRQKSTWNMGQETLGNIIREISTYDKSICEQNETFTYLYDITASDAKTNVSDAKDIESRRNAVNDYSKLDVTNYIAEVLTSHEPDYNSMYDRNQLLNDLAQNTYMTAETGTMVIELEYDRTGTQNQLVNNSTSYKITDVNLGLQERPKAQLILDKKVTNVKLTLSNGTILFDATKSADNMLWRESKPYEANYENNMLKEIRNNSKDKVGLIQMSMDEELMHGSTIEITYKLTVTNVGEVDYDDKCFYYVGDLKDKNSIVTTNANQVIDYVANNLQFNANDNKYWRTISLNEIKEQGLVNNNLLSQLEKYNTIIVTDSLSKELVPELISKNNSSVSIPLVLSQLITSENDTEDLTYVNISEIVKTSNTVGRRMEFSVVGNQDPTLNPTEVDTDKAEVVKILPPFGVLVVSYGMTALFSAIILTILVVGSIILYKKVIRYMV